MGIAEVNPVIRRHLLCFTVFQRIEIEPAFSGCVGMVDHRLAVLRPARISLPAGIMLLVGDAHRVSRLFEPTSLYMSETDLLLVRRDTDAGHQLPVLSGIFSISCVHISATDSPGNNF